MKYHTNSNIGPLWNGNESWEEKGECKMQIKLDKVYKTNKLEKTMWVGIFSTTKFIRLNQTLLPDWKHLL